MISLTCFCLAGLLACVPALADSRSAHGGRAAAAAETRSALMVTEAPPTQYPFQQRYLPKSAVPSLDEDDAYLESEPVVVSDPFEPWNRFWYQANDIFLMQLVKPLHETYVLLTPQEVRTGVNNFFHNLLFPIRFLNSLLQGDFYGAGVEVSRFVINTTLGLGGIFDVTKNDKVLVPVNNVPKEFGATLAYWGVPEGPYFMIPLFGPSTIRDAVGLAGDSAASPTTYIPLQDGGAALLGLRTLHLGDTALVQYEAIRKSSIEPYIALRTAYLQNRREVLARAGIEPPRKRP